MATSSSLKSSLEDPRTSRVVPPNDNEVSGSKFWQDNDSEIQEGDVLENQHVVEDDSKSQDN